MPEYEDSTTYLFADDTNIFKEIKSPNDEEKNTEWSGWATKMVRHLAIKVLSKQMQSANSLQ